MQIQAPWVEKACTDINWERMLSSRCYLWGSSVLTAAIMALVCVLSGIPPFQLTTIKWPCCLLLFPICFSIYFPVVRKEKRWAFYRLVTSRNTGFLCSETWIPVDWKVSSLTDSGVSSPSWRKTLWTASFGPIMEKVRWPGWIELTRKWGTELVRVMLDQVAKLFWRSHRDLNTSHECIPGASSHFGSHQMMRCDSCLISWTWTFRRWELRHNKYHTVKSVENCFSSLATLGNALVRKIILLMVSMQKYFSPALNIVTVYATSEFIFKDWDPFLMSRI